MYAAIRTYTGKPGFADELAAYSDDVRSIISGVKGVRAYYLVRTEDGCTTITVTDDEAGAEESSRAAAEWLRENASELQAPTPQVTGGEVLFQL